MNALTFDSALAYPAIRLDGIGLETVRPEASMQTLALTLYPGNTQVVQLNGLYDRLADQFPTGAALTATLADAAENPVAGFEDLPLAYVPDTPSSYAVIIDGATFDPVPGDYILTVSGTNGTSLMELDIPVTVAARAG